MIETLLTRSKLRATKPRVAVASFLFEGGQNKHVTAEQIADQLKQSGIEVALATVYNTLHHFQKAGLLKEVTGGKRGRMVFDTNTTPHHHIYNETTGEFTDIPPHESADIFKNNLPENVEFVGSDLIIRVKDMSPSQDPNSENC